MKFDLVLITPERATSYLEKNTCNRKLDKARVNHYAACMKDGKWFQETGEGVIISTTKKLLNGQHRLHAIIKANVSILMPVMSDVSDEAFKFIDQGKARTSADVLHTTGVKNANAIAAIIKGYLMVRNGRVSGDEALHKTKLTNNDILIEYQNRAPFWELIAGNTAKWHKQLLKSVKPAFLGSYYALFFEVDSEAADDFFSKLASGVGIDSSDNPIKRLRDILLIQLSNRTHRPGNEYLSAVLIKAWNAYKRNKPIVKLYYTPKSEKYPEIYGVAA